MTPIPTSIWNGFKHLMSRKDSMNKRAFKNELLKFSDGLRKEQITKPTLHKWSARGKCQDIVHDCNEFDSFQSESSFDE